MTVADPVMGLDSSGDAVAAGVGEAVGAATEGDAPGLVQAVRATTARIGRNSDRVRMASSPLASGGVGGDSHRYARRHAPVSPRSASAALRRA
jgi:hypothetical protein